MIKLFFSGFLSLIFAAGLISCGQTGALYLPTPQAAPHVDK